MFDYMRALHARFCREPELQKVREELDQVYREIKARLGQQDQEQISEGGEFSIPENPTKPGYEERGRFCLEERPKPALRKAGDAIVRVTLSSICSSDLHILHGSVPRAVPGTVVGHEMVGVVEAVGPGVKNFSPGDRVTVNVETLSRAMEAYELFERRDENRALPGRRSEMIRNGGKNGKEKNGSQDREVFSAGGPPGAGNPVF